VFREIPAARFDARNLPFASGSFDVTVCCYVLHHLTPEHAQAMLSEMVRVTRRRIVLLEDSLPRFDWCYRQRNRFHRINAAALYGEESATYRPPSNEAMFLTHDQWRAFARDIPGVSQVAIESLQDVTRWRPERKLDLIVANLFSELLIGVLPTVRRSLKPAGCFIFSGVMRREERKVVEAIRQSGLLLEEVRRRGKWVALAGRSSPKTDA